MGSVLSRIPRSSSGLLNAYLGSSKGFYGVLTGTSERTREETAEFLAKRYLCIGTKDEGCPCPSCKRDVSEHPDILIKGPSAAGNLLKSSTEEALSFLATSSVFSGKKCVILNHAHKMTLASTGDLLKMLEESIPHVMVILTASYWKGIPSTVRSRCRHIHTGDNTRQNLFVRMSENGLKTKLSEELSRIGVGLEVDACEKSDLVLSAHKAIPTLFTLIHKGDTRGVLRKFAEYASQQKVEGISILVNLLAKTAQDILCINFSAFTQVSMPSRMEWLTQLQKEIPEVFLLSIIEECKKVLRAPEQQRRALFIRALCLLAEYPGRKIRKESSE